MTILKHYGPGNHPSGSSQDAHAGSEPPVSPGPSGGTGSAGIEEGTETRDLRLDGAIGVVVGRPGDFQFVRRKKPGATDYVWYLLGERDPAVEYFAEVDRDPDTNRIIGARLFRYSRDGRKLLTYVEGTGLTRLDDALVSAVREYWAEPELPFMVLAEAPKVYDGGVRRPVLDPTSTTGEAWESRYADAVDQEYLVTGHRIIVRSMGGWSTALPPKLAQAVEAIPEEIWAAAGNPAVVFTDSSALIWAQSSSEGAWIQAGGLYVPEATTESGWRFRPDPGAPTVYLHDAPAAHLKYVLTHELGHAVMGVKLTPEMTWVAEVVMEVTSWPAAENSGRDWWAYPRGAPNPDIEFYAEAFAHAALGHTEAIERADRIIKGFTDADLSLAELLASRFAGGEVPIVKQVIASFPGVCGVSLLHTLKFQKHYGPGNHPSGSPQSDHAGTGTAEQPPLDHRGTRRYRDMLKDITNPGVGSVLWHFRATPLDTIAPDKPLHLGDFAAAHGAARLRRDAMVAGQTLSGNPIEPHLYRLEVTEPTLNTYSDPVPDDLANLLFGSPPSGGYDYEGPPPLRLALSYVDRFRTKIGWAIETSPGYRPDMENAFAALDAIEIDIKAQISARGEDAPYYPSGGVWYTNEMEGGISLVVPDVGHVRVVWDRGFPGMRPHQIIDELAYRMADPEAEGPWVYLDEELAVGAATGETIFKARTAIARLRVLKALNPLLTDEALLAHASRHLSEGDMAVVERLLAKHYGPGDHPGTGTPQSDHGRWATGLSAPQRTTALTTGGGFTVHDPSGVVPTTGFSVALKAHEESFPLAELTPERLRQYRRDHFHALSRSDTFWGAWVDTDTGLVYLDVVKVLPDRDAAIQLGLDEDQIAIYDLEKMEEIRLDEFRQQEAAYEDQPRTDMQPFTAEEVAEVRGESPLDEGVERIDLSSIEGRGKGHRWKNDRGFWQPSEVSRDTVRRRLDTLRKVLREELSSLAPGAEVPPIEYWLSWEEYKREVVPSSDGFYPLARMEGDRIVISPSIAESLFDYPGVGIELSAYRTVAHEIVHAISPQRPMVYPGQEQELEEGMAELLSLRVMADRFDVSMLERRLRQEDGSYRNVRGLEALAVGSVYTQHTTGLIMSAAEKVGWDREAIWSELERRWVDPVAYMKEDWTRYEYMPHRAQTAEVAAQVRIDEINREYDRLMETQGVKFPEHVEGWEADRQREIEYVRQNAIQSWEMDATQRWEAARDSARDAGIDVDRLRRRRPDSDQDWLDIGAMDTGQKPMTVEQSDEVDSVAYGLVYWLLGGGR